MEILIPSMIIQPFVENSIIHGLIHKEANGLLQIKVTQCDMALIIIVEDNGVGRMNSRKEQHIWHESKGYKLSELRLKALIKDKNPSIIYKDLNDTMGNTGTGVEIFIP